MNGWFSRHNDAKYMQHREHIFRVMSFLKRIVNIHKFLEMRLFHVSQCDM
jgi:hypothetical protein